MGRWNNSGSISFISGRIFFIKCDILVKTQKMLLQGFKFTWRHQKWCKYKYYSSFHDPPFSYYYEKPDYDRARFLSDIGGAAGLILGMSIASILGFIDCILIYFLQFISKTFRYCKKRLYRTVAKVGDSYLVFCESILNYFRKWICLQWNNPENYPMN